jgi:hypothetical protein
MKNKYIMMIRHFETSKNSSNKEKINYEKAFNKSYEFIYAIKLFLKKYPNITNIKFLTSDHERTLVTALVLSSAIKNEIINKKIVINIEDPIILNFIDRDPQKLNIKKNSNDFLKYIDNNKSSTTLLVFITHSSCLSYLYNSYLNNIYTYYNKIIPEINKEQKIFNYSLSIISVHNNYIDYSFNIKIKYNIR